tara:strand:+ start:8478 stop:10256 length:1779 start_codon:yes stop_codon:yes gene_type:complete
MELQQILFNSVQNEVKHALYSHVVKKRELYRQLCAGVGLDKLLRQYVRREDDALFKQRVQLTQHIVTSVCKNLMDVYYKVPRSNSGRRLLSYTALNDADAKATTLETILDNFWGDDSWDGFMATRFIELNATDPNAFVVFEFESFDNDIENVQPYPYEVSSENAVDFKYKNKTLSYLLVKDDHQYLKSGKLIAGVKYTMYGTNKTVQLLQVDKNLGRDLNTEIIDNITYIQLKGKVFEIVYFEPHNLGVVPAIRVGYYRDLATDGNSFVNPLHAAEPYLLKSIKTNSELDLVATLLAFPQMIKYGDVCEDDGCYKGFYDNGVACNTCAGTGIKPTANSSQDAIVIPMPDNREELLPLKELITYITPPVEIVKWQETYIQSLTEDARKMMFSSEIFSRSSIAQTATKSVLDSQNVYDTLWPFAIKFGKSWKKGVEIIAGLADLENNLKASFTFGKDFKLKTLETLVGSLKEAKDIGNADLVRHLNDDIAQIIFSEKPIEKQRYDLRQVFNPFIGKSEKEILVLLASPFVSKLNKILYANYSLIFDELEIDFLKTGHNFYSLNRVKQKEAILNKTIELSLILDNEVEEPEINLD